MNKIVKSGIALSIAAVIGLGCFGCAKKEKTQLDLDKFPLVYADENGLEAMSEGDEKPTLITKNFYTFLNSERKVQAASDGRIYYIETKNKTTTLGDLYAYDLSKKEAELIHSGVYSFKVSHDGECIIFSDGTGGIYQYNSRNEKKGDYVAIQSKGVSTVLDISADGKYVLYAQVLDGTKYYTLTLAETDFQTSEEVDKMSLKEKKANTDTSKAPVIVAENYQEYIGAADDLSAVYYTANVQSKNKKDTVKTLNVFKEYKESVVLSKGEFTNYFVNEKGEILYSETAKNTKKISDIVSDKNAAADKKLKKNTASAKAWKAKAVRDSIRKKINTYLQNISTTAFYRFTPDSEQAEQVLELSGQLSQKGIDTELGTVFFGGTLYDFSKAKKVDINKVSMAYKLFDSIKYRTFSAVNFEGIKNLEIGDKTEYNSGDCYVDTAAKNIHIIMNVDYIKTKVGSLYTVPYSDSGFGEGKLVSKKAAKVAHFDSGEDNYFVLANNTLVKNSEKTAVLKNYSGSVEGGKVKVAVTAVGTGKKDKFGNEIQKLTTYVLAGEKPEKIANIYSGKPIVVKGNMFAFYTSFDFKSNSGEVKVFNGKKTVDVGKKVSMIYKFG